MTQPVRTAPTLAEVAAAAGVSRSTASRALNDSPRISEETKKRVRAAAKKVNFVPNARGRALAVGRTEIIAVLVTEPLSELFSDPTYSEFLSGITEELSESSYLPVILQASSTHERNRAREHFERRSFDAVIDVSPYKGSELLEVLRELGVPTVLCGQLEGHPYRDVFSTVYSDDEEGGRFAALAMKERGRKDIVAVLGPQDNPAVVDRLRGYRTVLGEDLPGANVIYTGWNSGDGYQAMHQILAREIAFDGVLCGFGPYRGWRHHRTQRGRPICSGGRFRRRLRRSRDCGALRPRAHDRPPAPARRRPHGRQHCARHDQGRRAHHLRDAHAANPERLAIRN